MVGFGSAFRLSRRRGWETAYCDYETLKLLLTQIEAVYEEENTPGTTGDGFYYAGLSGFGSEEIFESAHEHEYHHHDDQLAAMSEKRRQRKQTRRNETKGAQSNSGNDWRDDLFAESDSSAAFASEYESGAGDDDDNVNVYSDRKQSAIGNYPSLDEAHFNYSYENSGYPSYGSSGSFGIGGASAATGSGIVSYESGTSMEHSKANTNANQNETHQMLPGRHSDEFRGFRSGIGSSKKAGPEQKKHKKRHRRNKVPPHLRRAHAKARAITGRFLGLLRAEIDKVALFTHSRMGELTDTIGSLRFPCDGIEIGNRDEHQLSDGGIHHASSSSEDEISISSGDDEINNVNNAPRFQGRQGRINGRIRRKEILEATLLKPDDRATFEQLNLAEQLRLHRPIFRSDQVLGDDFLLLSAVDEADAFTAVGVEFLHLLRYICVNAIAIRKLCKKHDRLLSSRMLGGYYHKLKNKSDGRDRCPNNYRLLNITPRRGNVKESSRKKWAEVPASTKSLVQQGKNGMHMLLGTYDSKVQDLANSLIADTLSESLELALSEFEVSRQRADRLSLIPIRKSQVASHESLIDLVTGGDADDLCYGFPSPKTFGFASKKPEDNFKEGSGDEEDKMDEVSTSSSISLTRLRFVVSSARILRDEAVQRRHLFGEYLSRSYLVVDGNTFVGEPQGLNGGCSRETMEFFSSYNPDLALIIDSHILEKALSPEEHLEPLSRILGDNDSVDNASLPQHSRMNSGHSSSVISSGLPTHNQSSPVGLKRREYLFRLNLIAVVLNTVSSLVAIVSCYQMASLTFNQMNYYIILPSAAKFCHTLGWKYAHSAVLIGITNLTSIMFLMYQSHHIHQSHTLNRGCSLKKILVISCLCPIAGNIFYSKAYENRYLSIAIIGRLLIGISSTELLSKHIILVFQVKGDATTEVARMKMAQIVGIVLAFLLGSFDIQERRISFYSQSFVLNFNTMPGYIMAFAWIWLLILFLCFRFPAEEIHCISPVEKRGELSISASEHEDHRHYRIDSNYLLPGILSRSSAEHIVDEDDQSISVYKPHRSIKVGSMITSIQRIKKLVMYNAALPVTFLLYGSVNLIMEVILTSSVIITNRYFKWSVSHTGRALSLLAALILPVHLVTSFAITKTGERLIMKNILVVMGIGILFLINYEALFVLCKDFQHLFRWESTDSPLTTYYDWNFGLAQYCSSATVIFCSCIALEGLSTTLMTKVSPEKLNKSPCNCSVIGPMLFCLCRFLGNQLIVFVGFSHRMINTDMVNSLAFILLGICFFCFHIVRKHYFFLKGS